MNSGLYRREGLSATAFAAAAANWLQAPTTKLSNVNFGFSELGGGASRSTDSLETGSEYSTRLMSRPTWCATCNTWVAYSDSIHRLVPSSGTLTIRAFPSIPANAVRPIQF